MKENIGGDFFSVSNKQPGGLFGSLEYCVFALFSRQAKAKWKLEIVQEGVLEVTQPCNEWKTYPAGIM